MKTIPLKVSAYDLAARFALLRTADQELNYIVNLLSYRTHSIITSTTLQKFAQMVVIDETTIYRRMDTYKSMDDLIDFCVAVNNMYRLGFITITDLRFIRIAADRHFRNMTNKRNPSDVSGKFSPAILYN